MILRSRLALNKILGELKRFFFCKTSYRTKISKFNSYDKFRKTKGKKLN